MNLYEEISKLEFGKCIGTDALKHECILVHVASLDDAIRSHLHHIFGEYDDDVCVLKVSANHTSLNCYGDFNLRNVPTLDWSRTLINGIIERKYFNTNQPMLHEKHTVIPATHVEYEQWQEFSQRCRAYGLYDDPTKIGTYDRWMELLDSKEIIM